MTIFLLIEWNITKYLLATHKTWLLMPRQHACLTPRIIFQNVCIRLKFVLIVAKLPSETKNIVVDISEIRFFFIYTDLFSFLKWHFSPFTVK